MEVKQKFQKLWCYLFTWAGKKARSFVDKIWPLETEGTGSVAELNSQILKLGEQAVLRQKELEKVQASVIKIRTALNVSQSALTQKTAEAEELAQKAKQLQLRVKQLEELSQEETDGLSEFRQIVIHYLIARQPFWARRDATNHFNRLLIKSLDISDSELDKESTSQAEKRNPRKIYKNFLEVIERSL